MKSLAERVAADPKVQDVFIDNTCGCLRGCDAAMIQPIIDAIKHDSLCTDEENCSCEARARIASIAERREQEIRAPFRTMSTSELMRAWHVTDEGFDGEAVFLISEELKRRGFTHVRDAQMYGYMIPPQPYWPDEHSHPRSK